MNDDLIIAIDSKGTGALFPLQCGGVISFYNDTVNHNKYSFASFSFDKKYAFLVTKATSSMTFNAFPIGYANNPMPKHSFRGLKEPVREIIPHPTRPIIFLRFRYEIYSWYYYHIAPLYNSVPEKGLMKKNEVYAEHEGEFDSSDDEEEEAPKYVPLKLMRREPEGVLNIFPDDVNFPNQIYFLPYQHQINTSNA